MSRGIQRKVDQAAEILSNGIEEWSRALDENYSQTVFLLQETDTSKLDDDQQQEFLHICESLDEVYNRSLSDAQVVVQEAVNWLQQRYDGKAPGTSAKEAFNWGRNPEQILCGYLMEVAQRLGAIQHRVGCPESWDRKATGLLGKADSLYLYCLDPRARQLVIQNRMIANQMKQNAELQERTQRALDRQTAAISAPRVSYGFGFGW